MATTEIQTSKMDQSGPGSSRVNYSKSYGKLWQVLPLLPTTAVPAQYHGRARGEVVTLIGWMKVNIGDDDDERSFNVTSASVTVRRQSTIQ